MKFNTKLFIVGVGICVGATVIPGAITVGWVGLVFILLAILTELTTKKDTSYKKNKEDRK